jgi:HK97 family phage major capsid protein
MNEQDIKKLKEALSSSLYDMFEQKLEPVIGTIAAAKVKELVSQLQAQRSVYGRDITGLSAKTKKDFVRAASYIANKMPESLLAEINTKANEALVVDQDNRGGYLVSQEVADAILRIAASVGTVISQASHWTMTKDELAIPNYTGSFLTGSFIGVDQAGTIQGLAFGQAVLAVKKWQLAFAVGNDLLQDENVNLAEWLLAIAAESLANMVDQQGLAGSSGLSLNGSTVNGPFVGVLGLKTTTTLPYSTGTGTSYNMSAYLYYLGNSSTSGKTAFSNYDVISDSNLVVSALEESVLDGSAFYFHRTTWAQIRSQKDTAGNYVLPYAAWAPGTLEQIVGGGPVRPAGYMAERPVYTNRWITPLSATAASTVLGFFGNLKALAFGDRGEMSVEVFTSGSFGSKEIALADQRGIVYRKRWAIVPALPGAFAQISTSAS